MSQKQLAEQMGITPTRLNYWEKDKREPNVAMIQKLAWALDVTGDYLLFGGSFEKKIPVPDKPEAGDLKRMNAVEKKLVEAFTEAGIVQPGQDLSDAQFEKIVRVIRILLEDLDT